MNDRDEKGVAEFYGGCQLLATAPRIAAYTATRGRFLAG
jgi:hypothetical protein